MKSIACELHNHTCHSDGRFTVDDLVEAAKNFGLDLIALTDHNTHSGWQDMEKTGMPFVHGMEWTTFFGHMIALNTDHLIDWRDATIENIDQKIVEVRNSGGIVGVAHPYQPGTPMCTGCYWDFQVRHWENVNYIEVWHGESNPPLQNENIRAKKLWLSLIDQGYRIAPAYGHDWHKIRFSLEPSACTYVMAECAEEKAVCDGIKAGRTLISLGPDADWWIKGNGDTLRAGDEFTPGEYLLHVDVDLERRRKCWEQFNIQIHEIRVYSKDERVLLTLPANGGEGRITLTDEPYLRIEAIGTSAGKECTIFLSAPIYRKK